MGLAEELAGLKQRRRSVRPDEMHALLTEAGFDRRHGKGDHWVYTHTKRRFPLTIDPRNPRGLHAELARQAEQEGVSLNQYVVATLAGATGYKREVVA